MLSVSTEFGVTPNTSLLIKNMLAIASLPSSFLIGVGSGWSLHCKPGELRHYPSQCTEMHLASGKCHLCQKRIGCVFIRPSGQTEAVILNSW